MAAPAPNALEAHDLVVVVLGFLGQGRRPHSADACLEAVELACGLGVQGQGDVAPARKSPVVGLGVPTSRIARNMHVLPHGQSHAVLLSRLVHKGQNAQIGQDEVRQALVLGIFLQVAGDPGEFEAGGVVVVRTGEIVVLILQDEGGRGAGGLLGLGPVARAAAKASGSAVANKAMRRKWWRIRVVPFC